MATWQPIQLAMQSYQARIRSLSSQRLLNLYMEAAPAGAKEQVALLPTPGLKPWLSGVGSGPCRGIEVMGDTAYIVSGGELYRVTPSKAATLIGSIVGTQDVQMTNNGTHVAIATETSLYAANEDGVITLSESGMNGAAYQDGYGIFTKRGTQQVWLTNLDDMTTISGLDFSTADATPDLVMGCVSDHRELWVFKERTIEIWQNVGDARFPFARAGGGFLECGTISSSSIAKLDRRIFWLGDDLRVYHNQGYQEIPVSTSAIEALIRDRGDQSSAVGFAYTQDGHSFYQLSFARLTVVYDASTGQWAERDTYQCNGRWRAQHYAAFAKTHIVGDFESGALFELDLDTNTDNDEYIDRLMDSATIYANGRKACMNAFRMDGEMGVGLVGNGYGSDPRVELQVCDDGGKTWSNPRTAPLGRVGEYDTQAIWTRLGTFYERVVRLRLRSPVKFAVLGAAAQIEVWS